MRRRLRPLMAFGLAIALSSSVSGQTVQSAAQKKTASASSKTDAKVPVARPATQPSKIQSKDLFVDVTRDAGIKFHLICGSKEKLYILETQCGGAAAFDYDNDGWMDILLVDGSTIEDYRAGKCHPPRLYRNQHDGTFVDVSAKSGLNFCGWGYGVAVGDFDNDGWEDVYISGFHGSALYHNNHDGTFTDVTSKAGVANADRWGTSAAFGDYDHDGNLDLYVADYVDIDINDLPKFGDGPFCQYRGIPVNCGPRGLKGDRDRLYHNNGDGTFTDVTEKLGIDPDKYYGLGVLWLDYDKDGCLDLYVANDSSPSLLYHNNCKGGFTETGAEAGVSYSSDGREQAGMGIDVADYDRDGWPDIVKTNFSDDSNNLYHNDHNGEFTDKAGASGIGSISIPYLGFGVKFLDFDNDGWPDLFVANGHVDPQVEGQSFGVGYAERPFLFRNLQNGKFEEIGQQAGKALQQKYVGRGALVADFWNRGRQDLLMTNLDGSPVLLRNESSTPGHWLRIKTIGAKSNRDGFGAKVEITADGLMRSAEVRAAGSFESSNDPRLHFGLGMATTVQSIVVRWPSGQVDKIGPTTADQELIIKEGEGLVEKRAAVQ
ncbi:MAG: CRTAC1 family protein [Acidobacteria bacterium]|nr:CRTAC1 family protein [Acidobacteriota bacterium]